MKKLIMKLSERNCPECMGALASWRAPHFTFKFPADSLPRSLMIS
jgi:hypothetical protein